MRDRKTPGLFSKPIGKVWEFSRSYAVVLTLTSISKKGRSPDNSAMGGILRQVQERVLPPSGPVGRDDARVLPHARRLSEILQRGAAEGEAGMAEPDAIPKELWADCIAGPKKYPHPCTQKPPRVLSIETGKLREVYRSTRFL